MKKILFLFVLTIGFYSCEKYNVEDTTNVIVVIDGVRFDDIGEIEGYTKTSHMADTGTYTTAGFQKLHNTYGYPLITGKEKLSFITEGQKNRNDRQVYRLARGESNVIVGLNDTDRRAHEGEWLKYLETMNQAAEYAILLNADIITTDHGRHCVDWTNHGDSCECCRKLIFYIRK